MPCVCAGGSFIGLISLQLSKVPRWSIRPPPKTALKTACISSLILSYHQWASEKERKDGDRLWIAIICEMPPHCCRAAPSLHHLPTSFISSARHWEHSTTHLPPVNIAWRLNYTHTHSQTQAQSQWNSLQCWSRESASNLWDIHSSEWVCVCSVVFACVFSCVFLWPLNPLLYGHICSPEGLCAELWTLRTHIITVTTRGLAINTLFLCFNKQIIEKLSQFDHRYALFLSFVFLSRWWMTMKKPHMTAASKR